MRDRMPPGVIVMETRTRAGAARTGAARVETAETAGVVAVAPVGPPSFGRVVAVATGMLMLELTLVLVGYALYGTTQDSSRGGGYGAALTLLPLSVPFLALFGGTGAAVLVAPTLMLAGSLERRFGRPGGAGGDGGHGGVAAPGWVVPAAVVVAAACALMAGVYRGFSPLAALVAWPAAVALIVPAALVARLSRRWLLRGIALWGTLAIAVAAALGGLALGSGVLEEYRPPAATRADVVGTWTDGRGGTLELAADGTATADGVLDPQGFAPLPGEAVETCTARGTWTFGAAADSRDQKVVTDLPDCRADVWEIGGEDGRIALHRWDVDGEEMATLTRER
ncbi:hypothetical protein ACFFSH_19695 [Streptomyces filamentosus]|uniref:hypothetical protein n=1 Tax=Streptomyces filamentosus TaxID=67294 RepID=UPI001673D0B0|nr:hypothetical protein [Streptomyces filamentosus]